MKQTGMKEQQDSLMDDAVDLSIQIGKIDRSALQRKLKVGYARAERLAKALPAEIQKRVSKLFPLSSDPSTQEEPTEGLTSHGIALKFAEIFQNNYPAKPLWAMMEDLRKDIESYAKSSCIQAVYNSAISSEPTQEELWREVGKIINNTSELRLVEELKQHFEIKRKTL